MSEETALSPGDRVEVSVTHEVRIDSDTSWIKYGVSTKVRENETDEQASARAIELVNQQVIATIQQAIATVNSIGAENAVRNQGQGSGRDNQLYW